MVRAEHLLISALTTALLSAAGFAQSAPRPSDEIVKQAVAARGAYLDEFRNLVSNENRTVTVYAKDGDVKRRKSVSSKFVVYRSTKQADRITEFRNVTAVNGEIVPGTEKRVEDFFVSVQKAESSAKELERIVTESQRYDDELAINGFTLFQGVTLAENLRPYFEFSVVGTEIISGVDTLVIEYRQTRPSPFIRVNDPPPSDGSVGVFYDSGLEIKNGVNERLSGRIWLDAGNYRIWKEQRTMTVQPEGFPKPVIVAQTDFEYGPSDFGILTPRRIVHSQYQILKKARASRKDVSVTLEYDKFRRPDVEVKVTEDSP
jgi:hypothetical protein